MTYKRRIERLKAQLAKRKRVSNEAARVQEATSDPYRWATEYTKTYNEHWVEEGRPSPYEPFPPADRYPHIPILFELFDAERIVWIKKSRDMMVSWACVAYLTLNAMKVPQRGVIFQTQKTDKVKQLIRYAKCLSCPRFDVLGCLVGHSPGRGLQLGFSLLSRLPRVVRVRQIRCGVRKRMLEQKLYLLIQRAVFMLGKIDKPIFKALRNP